MPDNAASQTLMASADTGGEAMSKFTLVIMAFSFAFAGIADRLDAYVVTRDGNRARAAVWPTTSIPYTKRFQMICCFVDLN